MNNMVVNMLHLLMIFVTEFTGNCFMHPIQNYDWSHAPPFTRVLHTSNPPMEGRDVMTLQSLLNRAQGIDFKVTGVFDSNTEQALKTFQQQEGLTPQDGVFTPHTAIYILKELMSDDYKDDGSIPKGVMFKLYIPVYRNRSIETTATLFDGAGNILHQFVVRTRGSTSKYGVERNQLTTNGDTPTGLTTMDLNSPEPKELVKSYGPYPVLRFVKGLKGNSAIGREDYHVVDGQETFLSNYRSGILVHTGIWDDWVPGQPMPNSNGCVHAYPEDQKRIVEILQNMGVSANENPFGKLPYPFKVQGIVSVEQLD